MWTRRELKEKAKTVFKASYWKCILVSLLLMLAIGQDINITNNFSSDDAGRVTTKLTTPGGLIGTQETPMDELGSQMADAIDNVIENDIPTSAVIAFVAVVCIVVLIIFVIAGALSIFLLNPLQIGCRRFFALNLKEEADLKDIGYGFSNGYKTKAKAMFLVDLKCFLWGLLFVIPGIIKKYEYMMVPYLLGTNEELTAEEALKMSSQMMKGQKWNAFVLNLSFIGWEILSLFTCGLLGIFYVNPYEFQTEAALFESLNEMDDIDENPSEYETYIEVE